MMIGPGYGTAQKFLGKGWWVMRDSNHVIASMYQYFVDNYGFLEPSTFHFARHFDFAC